MSKSTYDQGASQKEPRLSKKKVGRSNYRKFGPLLAHRWPEYVLEIIVVIIGITISLALSNFKEATSNKKLEQSYIISLREDISSDIKELEETIRQTEIVIQSGKRLLTQSDADTTTLKKEEFAILVRSVVGRPNFVSKNATFSSIKSSANFQLVTDVDLKSLLFEYDQQYEGLNAVELAELHETVVITGPYIMKYIPLIDSKRSGTWLKNLNVGNILREVEFVNNVALRTDKRLELLQAYRESLKIANLIHERLEQNINR